MMAILTAVGVACLVLLVLGGRKTLGRFFNAGRAQVGRAGRAVEEADPLAMYQQLVDDGVTEIQTAKTGLEGSKTLVNSVQRQVDAGEKEVTRLTSRIKAAVEAGDPNKTAADNALALAEAEKQLAENKAQLATHKTSYTGFAKMVESSQKKVLEARKRAQVLGVKLQQSEREKELSKFANNFTFDPNRLNDGLSRAEELINQKIDANRAGAEVALDMNKQAIADAADDELERQAAAAEILARFQTPQAGSGTVTTNQ
jgi:phage shock protein A